MEVNLMEPYGRGVDRLTCRRTKARCPRTAPRTSNLKTTGPPRCTLLRDATGAEPLEDDDDTPPRRAILKSTSNLSCSPAASYSSNPV